jgi:NADPH:quinone reductase-like Zn-dependent oxidoreductase
VSERRGRELSRGTSQRSPRDDRRPCAARRGPRTVCAHDFALTAPVHAGVLAYSLLKPSDEPRKRCVMKAVTFHKYGRPDVLAIEEVSTPAPRSNEVLIGIRAVAVSRSDCALRQGAPFIARFVTGLAKPKLPILGTELAGRIEAIGARVTRFKVGDQVFAASGTSMGADAEYVCMAEDGPLAIKPSNMTYEQAAGLCEGMLTALPFLRDAAKLRAGQTILINGASGCVGTAAVQIAKHLGATVTGVCGTAHLELVTALGADKVIDYTREDFTRGDQRYDVIFDTVAKSSFVRCRSLLTSSGVYLTTVPTLAVGVQMLTAKLGKRSAKIIFTGMRPASAKRADLAFIAQLAEAGKIRAVIDRSYAPEQAGDAHRYVEQGHKAGNVVMTFAGSN